MKSVLGVVSICLCLLPLFGCQSILNARFPPGEMGPDGKVYPCNDYRSNAQACGEARYNAPRVRKINLGMELSVVKSVMGRDPEERVLKVVETKSIEIWGYLVDYDNTIVSLITFTDGKVTSIESVRR